MPRKRPETRRRKISKMLIEEYKPQSAQDKCTRYIRSFKRPSRRYNGSTFKSRIRWTFRL